MSAPKLDPQLDPQLDPHVVLVRRAFAPPPVPALGYELTVPAFVAPAIALDEVEDLPAALGWPAAIPIGARHARIDAISTWGLIEPSAWERAFVAWAARELGAELLAPLGPRPAAGAHTREREPFAEVRERLAGLRPWRDGGEVPVGVAIQRAATRRGEARAVARQVRAWLLDQLGGAIPDPAAAARRCDEILILVPDDPDRVVRFAIELERVDLPVRAERRVAVLATGLGRWILSLAELAGWGAGARRARRRELLDEVALAPFVSLPHWAGDRHGSASRRRLRELIASLRRPSVDLDGWRAHAEAVAARMEARGGDQASSGEARPEPDDRGTRASAELLTRLAEQLADGPGLIGRFRRLLAPFEGEPGPSLGVRARIHALPDDQPGKALSQGALERILRALDRLVAEEQAHGGHHPRLAGGGERLAGLLRETVGDAALVARSRPEHGVTVLPYSGYDGRGCALLVCAGLEEGGYPQLPSRPTQREATWLRRLGLLAGDEGQELDARIDETVLAELERQIRVCDRAIAHTRDHLILSFATEAGDGRATHPGALLSLLLGGWDEATWDAAPRERVTTTTRADEAPASPAEASSWFELGHYPDAVAEPDVIAEGPSREALDDHGRAALDRLAERRAGLLGSRALQREHAPAAPGHPSGDAAFGPYTGRLPGPLLTAPRHSATALEQFNACRYRYFLQHVLGVGSSEAGGANLSAIEQGNLVHHALADTVHELLADLPDASFDFLAAAPDREARVTELLAAIEPRLRAAASRLAADQPTLSRALVDALVERWLVALRRWIDLTLQDPGDLELDEVAILRAPECADRWATVTELRARSDAYAAFEQIVRAAIQTGGATTQASWVAAAKAHGLNQAQAKRAHKRWQAGGADEAALARALAEQREDHDLALTEAEAALDQAKAAELARRRATVARRQRYAELGFGGSVRPGDDPASVPGSFALALADGRAIALRGSVDRVDVDPDKQAFAVLDYKTGSAPAQAFAQRLLDGTALQPTLYALALTELADRGLITPLAGHQPRAVGYLYPKVAREDLLDPTTSSGWALADASGEPGPALTWLALTQLWVEHITAEIAAGRFDLYPTSCPKLPGGGWCDVEHACRIQPDHLPNFAAPGRPTLVPTAALVERSRARAAKLPPLLPPNADPEASRAALTHAAAEHERAMTIARALDRDVVINAGAGTGKTYSLVLRYLQILADGVLPARILCATFTRRAAAEMVHRIRQALLGSPSGPLATVVEHLRRDPADIRRIVLSLSMAPITTIDSVGFRLLTEARDAAAERDGASPPAPLQVLDPAAAARELDDYVTAEALAALDRGDPALHRLLTKLPPDRLLDALRSAVAKAEHGPEQGPERGPELDLDPATIAEGWWQLADVVAAPILAHLRGLDHAAIAAVVAEAELDRLDPGVRAALDDALAALAELIAEPSRGRAATWAALARLAAIPTTAAALHGNKGQANRPLYERIQRDLAELSERAGLTPEAQAAFGAWCEEHPRVPELAQVAAEATALAHRWHRSFVASLERRGVLRFEDVEQRLAALLDDPAVTEALRERVPVAHVLVDESQDTSARQVAILDQLAAIHDARSFWVGDPKQSIYRFRGAEVDVFERRCQDAHARGAVAAHLTVNRRSRASILAAVNALFAPLFPAERDGVPLDPRAGRIDYMPLVAPTAGSDAGPTVELIVAPATSWRFDADASEDSPESSESGEPSEEPRATALDVLAPTDSELAAVQRIVEILEAELGARSAASAHGPHVAVLASSWAFVARFRRLLAAVGVEAAVEGGRGLLTTLEARSLTDWLAHAVRRDAVTRVAVLRGPGIALSDAGLYALRLAGPHGEGSFASGRFDGPDGPRLGPAEIDAVVERWAAADPTLDVAHLRSLLTHDGEALARYRATWAWFEGGLGHRSCFELLTELADRLGLWALWRERGCQALANAEATLELIRQIEASFGVGPRALVRQLDALRDRSDPPADGIEADAGAAVVITTIWQAKGREWPVVVLPELQRVQTRTNAAGLGGVRLVRGHADGRAPDAVRVAEIVYGSPRSPFATEATAVRKLIDLYRAPQDRAELRRLLYVAMTRPKQRLILTATISPPPKRLLPPAALAGMPSLAYPSGAFTLCGASDWARTIQVATALDFDGPDQPRFGEGSVWSPAQVELVPAGPIRGRLELAERARADAPTTIDAAGVSALLARLTPIRAPERPRLNPSALPPLTAAPAYERVGGGAAAAPRSPFASAAIEGTAVHAVLERWCFGRGGTLDAALVTEVLAGLELVRPDDPAHAHALVDHVLALWAENQRILAAELDSFAAAAARGEVLHEVPIRAHTDEGEVEGRIDLLWRPAPGAAWAVVDYKDTLVVDHARDDEALRKHAAQVELYARLVGTGGRAIWYLRAGELVRW